MIKGNYLKGLKGLTKQDRQNWEKQYSSLLQGKTYDNDQLNQLYLNTKFKEDMKLWIAKEKEDK